LNRAIRKSGAGDLNHSEIDSATGTPKRSATRAARERVLVEFPATLLKMADEAAAMLDKNRSELIRTAVEQYIERLKKKRLEEELASAYVANAAMNLEIAEDFANVDREGF
jgi:metal-responsive CopG/Arc/MetJ family transcriptional regulator